MRPPINFEDYLSEVEPHRRIRRMVLSDLQEMQTIYPSIMEKIYEQEFGTADFNDIMKKAEEDNFSVLFSFRAKVQKAIDLERSFIDVEKLVRVLQNQGGMAFQAFSHYTCKICGKEGIWHNSNTPDFCDACAVALAQRIAERADEIIKE